MIPAYKDILLLSSNDPPNPNRAEALFLGLVAGPFNWPTVLWAFYLKPILSALGLIARAHVQLAIGTALALVIFPISGILGRIRMRRPEDMV